MRTRELIKLMPTQYRRKTDNPLYSGHFIPLLGYWTETEGFVKKQDLKYESEVLSCPIIAVVETKLGNKDLELTITGKNAVYDHDTTEQQGSHTLTRKHYVDAVTTTQTVFTVPRFTRPHATFLLTGLGNKIWGIESITTGVTYNVGKINFYALASNGSRIIYWFGMWKLAEELKQMVRYWIAPTKCNRCYGSGIEPETEDTACVQCGGYKYSGYSTTKYVQRNIGYDVGLSRGFLNWDALTDDEHEIVKRFINKAWTQKWWVTPTKKEIKRLFAHFYNLPEANIFINERFNLQEPVWTITLPESGSVASPFGRLDESDRSLMKYIAESLTPAGVSVFVGFYTEYWFGDMETFSDRIHVTEYNQLATSMVTEYSLWGHGRWDFYNGWTIATDDFEREGDIEFNTGYFPATYDFKDDDISTLGDYYGTYSFEEDVLGEYPIGFTIDEGIGTIKVIDELDGHNMVTELNVISSGDTTRIDQVFTAGGQTDGTVEFWIRSDDVSDMIYMYLYSASGYVIYFQATGAVFRAYYDLDWHNVATALDNVWYHIKMYWYDDVGTTKFSIWIDGVQVVTDEEGLNNDDVSYFRLTTGTAGTNYSIYLDALGYSWDDNYDPYDNTNPYGKPEDLSTFITTATVTVGTSLSVIDELDGHKNVMRLADLTSTGNVIIKNYFTDGDQTDGTIEFWIHSDDVSQLTQIMLRGSVNAVWLAIAVDKVRYYYDSTTPAWHDSTNGTLLDDTWYHFKIDFDCGSDTYDFYLDGDLLDADIPFYDVATDVNYIQINTDTAPVNTTWVDAIGYSWDTYYTNGDNRTDEMWTVNGDVSIVNVNDQNRHMAKLTDNCYLEHHMPHEASGTLELWTHPAETDLRIGMRGSGQWLWYIDYDVELSGWYDNNINLLTKAMPNNDYHVSVYYDDSGQTYDVGIMQQFQATGIPYLNSGIMSGIRVENIGTGCGFFDAIGFPDDSWYTAGDNWQRLHPYGWGIDNSNGEGYYYATYGFENESTGTYGTAIDFINVETSDDSTYSATIIGEEDGHKKVLRFLSAGDNSASSTWRHYLDNYTCTVYEFWLKHIDHGIGSMAYTFRNAINEIIWIYYDNTANKFYAYYGDGLGGDGYTSIGVDVEVNTWFHIKVTVDFGTDTQTITVNGIDLITNKPFFRNRVASDLTNFWFSYYGLTGANSVESYLDAFGESDDIHYNIGYNKIEYNLMETYFRRNRFFDINI